MVRGLTVNQVYGVKSYGGSSPPCRANKNVIAVVSWWWNHLKNLRCVAQSGRALDLGSRGFPGSNPGTPIHLWVCQVTLKATYLL